MKNNLLIHHDNVPFLNVFDYKIFFKPTGANIDRYITNKIIPEIKKIECDVIYIKDSLSENYLELYGLRLAYHIRLSMELREKRFVPIVILSNLDGYLLNKISPMAKILFTKNIFIIPNKIKSIKALKEKPLHTLSEDEYENDFLEHIELEPPEDSTNHSIANEWAIYRWADFLNINDSEAIRANNIDISSKLYFKYLLAKNPLPKQKGLRFVPRSPNTSGKILYIDDQWSLGWQDIFKKYFSNTKDITFKTIKDIDKDTQYNTLEGLTKTYISSYNPDLILLDMRLVHDDIEEQSPKNISGIKLLKMIKEEINPGIQVAMLTASGKSLILNEANKYNIVGYIKKEHPEDKSLESKETFKALKSFVNEGLDKKYLKQIWQLQNEILSLNIFENTVYTSMQIEIKSVFEILDSDMKRKYTYAMLAIYKCIEIINDSFISEKVNSAYWKGTDVKISHIDGALTSTKNKIFNILHKRLSLSKFDENIKQIVYSRNNTIHPGKTVKNLDYSNMLDWFEMISDIMKQLDKKK